MPLNLFLFYFFIAKLSFEIIFGPKFPYTQFLVVRSLKIWRGRRVVGLREGYGSVRDIGCGKSLCHTRVTGSHGRVVAAAVDESQMSCAKGVYC